MNFHSIVQHLNKAKISGGPGVRKFLKTLDLHPTALVAIQLVEQSALKVLFSDRTDHANRLQVKDIFCVTSYEKVVLPNFGGNKESMKKQHRY